MRTPTPLTRRHRLTGALGSLAGAVPWLLRSPWAQAQGAPPDWREAEPVVRPARVGQARLAARFAAKEAVMKALGVGWRALAWRDM